jgi:ubiquinone/menaquinone biosynthesis C-methylase UbiE
MGRAYDLFTRLAINRVKPKMINLLKVDLWNEGVEREKDVLSKYQNISRLDLYAVDIAKNVCFLAKPNVPKVHITQATIEKLPFKDDCFDVILDLPTLDHIPETKAIGVIKEYKRVLNKNGVLLLIFRYENLHNKCGGKKTDTSYYFSKKLIRTAEKTLESVEEYTIGALLPFGRLLDKLPKRLRNFILELNLIFEHSGMSKNMLKQLGAFYVILGQTHSKETIEYSHIIK